MMSDPDHEALRELAAALKHDLGKYVAWRSINLPEQAWAGPLDDTTFEALRCDLMATRAAASGDESAWALFDRLAADWPRPWPAALMAVATAIDGLRGLQRAFEADARDDIAAARPQIRAAQASIRTQLAALVRSLA
jgi:hypothetical protein